MRGCGDNGQKWSKWRWVNGHVDELTGGLMLRPYGVEQKCNCCCSWSDSCGVILVWQIQFSMLSKFILSTKYLSENNWTETSQPQYTMLCWQQKKKRKDSITICKYDFSWHSAQLKMTHRDHFLWNNNYVANKANIQYKLPLVKICIYKTSSSWSQYMF